jgi:methylmalonyl-CoA mutase C-terminal domain/subunit
MSGTKIKVLMSKPGTDGHWRGIVTISRGLRDAGMEVIFGGFQSVDEIVESAIQEDIDVIGLSIHSGAHVGYVRRLMERLRQEEVKDDFMVLVGGAIPCEDFQTLKEVGVAEVFGPGTMIPEIVEFIEQNVRSKDVAQ